MPTSGVNAASYDVLVGPCEFCPFDGGYVEAQFDPDYDPSGLFWDCPDCGEVNRKDTGYDDH